MRNSKRASRHIPALEAMPDVLKEIEASRQKDKRTGFLVAWGPRHGARLEDEDEKFLRPFLQRGFVHINDRYYTVFTQDDFDRLSRIHTAAMMGKILIYITEEDKWIQLIVRLAKNEAERRLLVGSGML